jgi:hypothetical protein
MAFNCLWLQEDEFPFPLSFSMVSEMKKKGLFNFEEEIESENECLLLSFIES